MAVMNVNPTRMQLSKLKKQLATAMRGHKLLKDKRDELMRQFLERMRESKALRERVEASLRQANVHFVEASSVMSRQAMDAALMCQKQQVLLRVSQENVMSVDLPCLEASTRTEDKGDIYPYGFAFTSFELDGAVESVRDLLPDLIRLAELEKSVELMADEIEKTRRRVNALEHVMIPRYQDTIHSIQMKLEENERGSRTRLMKVKDMMLEQAHHYKEAK